MHFSPFLLHTSFPQWNITHCHKKAKKSHNSKIQTFFWTSQNVQNSNFNTQTKQKIKNSESKAHLLSSVSLIFNKLETFARTCADPTTLDGKLSWAKPTFSRISLILAATMQNQIERIRENLNLTLTLIGGNGSDYLTLGSIFRGFEAKITTDETSGFVFGFGESNEMVQVRDTAWCVFEFGNGFSCNFEGFG